MVLFGFDSLCGYPRRNILGIRVSKLNWKVLKETNLYLRFPSHPFSITPLLQLPKFHINRPNEGFFGRQSIALKLANNNIKFGFLKLEFLVWQ